jgi:hypothetical protein
MTLSDLLDQWLSERLPATGQEWLSRTRAEISQGLGDSRFCTLISLASRKLPRGPLSPTSAEQAVLARQVPQLSAERWSLLECGRIRLVLARGDLAEASGEAALEEAFRFADEGELCALYRTLALLPEAQRFAWRAGEGCRSNMRTVFEAAACDTPYPKLYFDAVAFDQALLKSLFIEAPLWRIAGLDERLTPKLARMALDYADERRSAGRSIPPALWLCLGKHGGERGSEALLKEWQQGETLAQIGVAFAWGRAQAQEVVEDQLQQAASSSLLAPTVLEALQAAAARKVSQADFRFFMESENAVL